MNQILDYNPVGNGNGGSPEKSGLDKIIKVAAVLVILLAIALIGIAIFNRVQNKQNPVENKEETAKVETIQEEDGLKISISSDTELTKLIYSWNEGSEHTIPIEKLKNYDTKIEIPSGESTITLKVIDINGNETDYSNSYNSENGIDLISPIINFEVTEEKKIRITATDETAIDFITYRWNDEEEKTKNADGEFVKELTEEIDIRPGKNLLTVIAVDKSENTTSKEQSYEGKTQPKIQVVLSEDKSKLLITCTHESGIYTIDYTLNDKPYSYKAEEGQMMNEISFEQALDVGYNKIILNVTSGDGTTTNFGGECTYSPEEDINIQ